MFEITFNVIAICVPNEQKIFCEEYERRKDMRSLGTEFSQSPLVEEDIKKFSKHLFGVTN